MTIHELIEQIQQSCRVASGIFPYGRQIIIADNEGTPLTIHSVMNPSVGGDPVIIVAKVADHDMLTIEDWKRVAASGVTDVAIEQLSEDAESAGDPELSCPIDDEDEDDDDDDDDDDVYDDDDEDDEDDEDEYAIDDLDDGEF